ncbi:uncharacterized protein LOC119594268 [Penaeus monodon]|uniref:uncharacterized protein LOC119594268 n=1 Tax=Penaeus monodon TaxID=6687 RepID=UPI0018A6D975|nr:uncharacterized protein LOC119594268 [Penaeus monodon]
MSTRCSTERRKVRQRRLRKRPLAASPSASSSATSSTEEGGTSAGLLSSLRSRRQRRQQPMHEMLHVARECSNREAGGRLLTFGELCLFTTELRQCYEKETPGASILQSWGCRRSLWLSGSYTGPGD